MKNVVFICAVLVILMASCGKNSSEYKDLQAQNDSLLLVNKKVTTDLDEMLSLLNDVEDSFQSIKSAQNYLTVQSTTGGEMTPDTRQRLADDMKFVTETLNKNKDQIAKLESQLKNSGIQSSQLKKTIKRLHEELNEKTETLVSLQAQLGEKDQQIADLSESISLLSTDVQNLHTQSQEQQQIITKQEKTINSAYYCFGTSKELKEQKILENGQLGSNFNKEYFIKVKDINTFNEIDLFAKKAKLVTKHPSGSYEMVKDNSGNLVFKILDPKTFWSISKYLVIEVS